jgi:hypothetical protein
LSGVPRENVVPYPFKILNTNGAMIVILYEALHSYRQIFMDGRPLPKDPNPTWMGYSIGHWDGDTLVVESAGFVDNNWLDNSGHPGTEAMHLTERFHRRDFGHIDASDHDRRPQGLHQTVERESSVPLHRHGAD